MFQFDPRITLAISLQSTKRDRLARFLTHRRKERGIVNGSMGVTLMTDGSANQIIDLSTRQSTRTSRSNFALQRGSCSIPLAMPFLDCLLSSLHSILMSKSREAMSTAVCLVLCEDVMFQLGCECIHSCLHTIRSIHDTWVDMAQCATRISPPMMLDKSLHGIKSSRTPYS